MKKALIKIVLSALLLISGRELLRAQVLNVSVVNIGNNRIRIKGTPTSPGFTSGADATWTGMNLTWRIPKTATVPGPTGVHPAPTPEVTGETNNFTALTPRNVWDGNMDLTMFDLTAIGEGDDGYWYFQAVNTTDGVVQSIAEGDTVVLYEFTLPSTWSCLTCVEVVTENTAGIPVGLGSFISNGSSLDVLVMVQNNAPLPVEFVSFEAKKRGDQAALIWKTTQEQNVKGYYVERSSNGSSYHKVGYVAALESALLNTYTFTDAAPLKGNNYYRIREEDLDGKAQYSEIRVLTFDGTGALVAFVYPVPVSSKLKVDIQAQVSEKATLRIADMHGRTVLQQNVQLRVEGNLETIGVSQLKSGLYVIELVGSTVRWTGKFIKE